MANKLKFSHDLGPSVTLALFRNLESCKDIRQTVMSGKLECSLLKTKMILNVFQVQVAAHKAVQLYKSQSMTTKNVHSEILYCLSPSKHITDSFKSFGVSDADTSLFAVLVDDNDDERFNQVCKIVGSDPVPLEEAEELADTSTITQSPSTSDEDCDKKKAYKLTKEELSVFPILDAVVSRIAAKEIITASKGKR